MALKKSPAPTRTHADYQELLTKLQDIPTLPVVAVRVNELINDPLSSSADIADVLKKDQVLTAKILRLVNSSYYAIPGGVTDVQRALAFLGFNTIAQLLLGLSVFSVFKHAEAEEFSMPEFWKHALGTAVCAEVIAKRLKFAKPEEAFTCGLLHDIGKLVLHEIDPESLYSMVREARERKCSFLEVERDREIPTHLFLGERIAERWGLPQLIRQVIHYHHSDVSQLSTILASSKPVIMAVRLANQMVNKNKIGRSGNSSPSEITEEYVKALGLSLTDLPQLEKDFSQAMDRAGALLNAYR